MAFQRLKGFTLIELSIVLVIIGLLVGGVLVGKDLIRSAELRSVVADWQQFENATKAFRMKYGCIPGDCDKASSLSLGANGNSNDYIDIPTSNNESFQFWQHLGNAGLINGSFSGVTGPAGNYYDSMIGTNVPASRIRGVGYGVWQRLPLISNWHDYIGLPTQFDHLILTGTDTSTDAWQTWGAAFGIGEAMSIDTKMDDGYANSGRVRVHRGYSQHSSLTCTTGTMPNYSYNTSGTDKCTLMYMFVP